MPPPVVGLAAHPGGELGGPVTGEDQVGVAVDEPGQHARAAGSRPARSASGACGCRPDPRDPAAVAPATAASATTPSAAPSPAAGSLVTSSPMLSYSDAHAGLPQRVDRAASVRADVGHVEVRAGRRRRRGRRPRRR